MQGCKARELGNPFMLTKALTEGVSVFSLPPTTALVFLLDVYCDVPFTRLMKGGGVEAEKPGCPGRTGRPLGPESGGWSSPLLLMLFTTPLIPAVTADTTFWTTCWPAAGFGSPAGGLGSAIGFGNCAVSAPLFPNRWS